MQDFLSGPHAGGPLEPTQAGNLAVQLPLILDGKPGISSVLELVIFIAGTAGTLAGFLLLVWKLVRPHVVGFLDTRIQAVQHQVGQVQAQVERVSPRSGPSLDDHHQELVAAVQDVRQQLGRLHRRLDKHKEAQEHTHQVLTAHVEESAEFLGRASELLAAQGVQLPPRGPQRKDSE